MKLFLLVLLALTPAWAWAEFKVLFVDGTVEYKADAGAAWKSLNEGQTVAEAGYVRVGEKSALELLKAGKVRMVFSANTLARLKFSARAEDDRVLMQTGKILTDLFQPGASMQIRTSNAAMGVRGTQFTVLANGEDAEVAVKKGAVYTLGKSDDDPQGVLVKAGQKSLVNPGEAPRAQAIAKNELDYFDFGVYDDLAKGKVGDLYDHFAAQDDAFFQKFAADDLADYQLFVLDELDDQWQFYLKEHSDFAKQLRNAPLKAKP